MDHVALSEMLYERLRRDVDLRGRHARSKPDVDVLWDALDGDGPMALIVTLEYMAARRRLMDERLASELRQQLRELEEREARAA